MNVGKLGRASLRGTVVRRCIWEERREEEREG